MYRNWAIGATNKGKLNVAGTSSLLHGEKRNFIVYVTGTNSELRHENSRNH